MRKRKLAAHPAALHNRVLNAWATTTRGEIAQAEGISPNTVLSIVRNARERGDRRAVHKPPSGGIGWWKEGDPRVQAIATAGARASVEARRLAREIRL